MFSRVTLTESQEDDQAGDQSICSRVNGYPPIFVFYNINLTGHFYCLKSDS